MDINTMRIVLNTLNKISVSGKENLGYVLGLVQLFESEILKKAKEDAPDEQDHKAEKRN